MSFNPKASYVRGETTRIPYTPSGAVSSGDVVVVNDQLYVSDYDIAAGAPGTLVAPTSSAIFNFLKHATAFSFGDLIYWDEADQECNSDSGNPLAGVVMADVLTGDARVNVLILNLSAATTVNVTNTGLLANAITDPGDAGAIPVTVSGYCPLVTGSAHTRTLAAPAFIGQQILLYVKTDGGTVVITVATAVNQTGNNTLTMAAVRAQILLTAIESGSSKVWCVTSNDGAALSTVP